MWLRAQGCLSHRPELKSQINKLLCDLEQVIKLNLDFLICKMEIMIHTVITKFKQGDSCKAFSLIPGTEEISNNNKLAVKLA